MSWSLQWVLRSRMEPALTQLPGFGVLPARPYTALTGRHSSRLSSAPLGLWPGVCLPTHDLAQHLCLLTWHGEAFRLWIRLLKGGGEGGVLFVLHRCFLRRTSLLSLCISQWHWNVCRVRSRCWQRRALLLQDAGEQQGTAGAFAAFTATHSSDRNYPRASLT